MTEKLAFSEMQEPFDFKQLYYKVIHPTWKHFDYTYQPGLNIDHHPFNSNEFCAAGGLHFTDKNNLFKFIDFGNQIATLSIPPDAQIKYDRDSWKANKIFIHDIKPFKEYEFFQDEKFCLDAVNNLTHIYMYGNLLDSFAEKIKTKQFYLSIIKSNINHITMIPKFVKTSEFYREALQNHLDVLFDVPTELKTYELCLLAVSYHGETIKHVPGEFYTNEMLLTAIKDDFHSIKHISPQYLTYDLLLSAVTGPKFWLGVIPVELRTEELCLMSLKSYFWQMNFYAIPSCFKTPEFYIDTAKKYPHIISILPTRIKTPKFLSIVFADNIRGKLNRHIIDRATLQSNIHQPSS